MQITKIYQSPQINVQERFGAKGDGTHDDTAAIQAAIDAANSLYTAGYTRGATVYLPFTAGGYYASNLILKNGVQLVGGDALRPGSFLHSYDAGWVIDTTSNPINDASISRLTIHGLKGANNGGIRIQNGQKLRLEQLFMGYFDNQAILLMDGGACALEDVTAYSGLLNRTLISRSGAIEINGHDHFIRRVEGGCGIDTDVVPKVSSSNLYCAGIKISGYSHFVSDCNGEMSDIGIDYGCKLSRFVNCRGDYNYGPGFFMETSAKNNTFTNCLAYENSQDTTNTYDGFSHPTAESFGNQFVNCKSISEDTSFHRYGFYDNCSSQTNKNTYLNCRSLGHVTGAFYLNTTYGASVMFPHGVAALITDRDATPSVDQYCSFETNNTNPTSITNFDNGIDGQKIDLLILDAKTTIVNGATLKTSTDANMLLAINTITSFVNREGVWYQLSGENAWTDFVPTLTSSVGTITSYTITTARYKLSGKQVQFDFDFTITNNGSGSGTLILTLPINSALAGHGFGAAVEKALTGNMVQIYLANATTIVLVTYAYGYPGATNARVLGGVIYESA